MRSKRGAFRGALVFTIALVGFAAVGALGAEQSVAARLDAAVAEFWTATSDDEVAAARAAILATDPDIEAVWSRLRRGRTYARDVPDGTAAPRAGQPRRGRCMTMSC